MSERHYTPPPTPPRFADTRYLPAPLVSTHRCQIGPQGLDWELVDGLPVATAARIIEDLTAAGVDGSHLGIAIEDAVHPGLMSADKVYARLNQCARAWNAFGGKELTRRLLTSAGYSGGHESRHYE